MRALKSLKQEVTTKNVPANSRRNIWSGEGGIPEIIPCGKSANWVP